jgi:hypothetical protein
LKLLPVSFIPLYSTYLGGSGDEFGYGINAEEYGSIWFGGSTSSTNFPVDKGFQETYAGGPFDAFLTHLTLTPKDYLNILNDLAGGTPTLPLLALDELTTAQKDYANKDMPAVMADLARFDQLICSLNRPDILAASRQLQQTLTEQH